MILGEEERIALEDAWTKCKLDEKYRVPTELEDRMGIIKQKAPLYPDNYWLRVISELEADSLILARARIYYIDGKYKEAANYFSDLKNNNEFMQNPEIALEIHLSLARSYIWLGLDDRAIEECEQANRLYPKDSNLHLIWGEALLNKGDLEQALLQFDEAYKLASNLPIGILAGLCIYQAITSKADCLRKLGREEEAAELEKKHGLKKTT